MLRTLYVGLLALFAEPSLEMSVPVRRPFRLLITRKNVLRTGAYILRGANYIISP